ncbi:glycosyltransferase [Algoriphagus marinus]|uniref:glycosyltransferase n=1 Tax=Algoriphagus marinus TaxID=1925762 RepID=UPI00094BA1C9|nr:glycosyltransferase [Algoriphagus marinus]
MNKGTILFLLDTLQTGGAEKSLLEITSRFQHFKPVFATLFAGRHDLLADYEAAGIEVIRLGLPVSNKFKDLAKYVDRVVSDQNAVIVHSSIFRSDMTARHLKSKVKIVNSLVNNSYRKRRYDGLPWKGKLSLLAVQLLDRFTISSIDLMIANSQVLVDSHRKTIGLNPNKTVVIHRGRPIPIKTKALPTTHFPLRTAHWLCVGRLIERKGHKDLLHAFANLLQARPNDQLILAGDGDYRGAIEKEIERLEIGNSVDLLGTVGNVSELLEKSDFFVFPSYFEGLPGSVIEAMLAKIPIICSDIPENKECLKEGMCLFHRVGDQDDLLAQMQQAISLKDWDIRTDNAYEYARENFDIEKIATQYEETYLKLLASP